MTQAHLEPAYVLHARAYRETSLLLEMLTPARGRLGLIARGARRSGRSSRSGQLQAFVPLLIDWRGRGELPVLAVCERDPDADAGLPGERLALGLYLNELLVRLLPRDDPHERLFILYRRALAEFRAVDDVEPTLRRFELALLEELGYGMDLTEEADSGQPVRADGLYCVELERGAVPASGSPDGEFRVRGGSLLALASGRFDDADQRRESRRLMAAIIRHYLGGVEPRSRQLLMKHWTRP